MIKRIKKAFQRYSWKELLREMDDRYGLAQLERLLFSNWFNPLATLWLCFRSFPLRQAIYLPVFVYGRPRLLCLSGMMRIEGRVKSGMIKFNNLVVGAPSIMSVQSEICNQGTIIFHGAGRIGTGNRIRVARHAILDIGAHFKIMDMCNIGCFQKILIGAQSWIVHRCQVLDANYHFVANFSKGIIPKWVKPIIIGKGCWICNTSTISGGTILPDFTIVASNSLVGKDMSAIPESSMIGGVPAKLIATGFRRVENRKIEEMIWQYYREHPEGMFVIPAEITPKIVSEIDN